MLDRNLARHVAYVAHESSHKLTDIIPLLKDHCDPEEYAVLGKAIATAAAEIYLQVSKNIFAQYPDLEKKFYDQVDRYGRIL